MKPTAAQVWEAMLADERFVIQAPEGSARREAIRPFVEGSVEALADQLDTVVTLKALIDAKAEFLRYCLDNSFGKVMGDVVGMDADMITGMLMDLLETVKPMLRNIVAFLEENGVTEEQVLTSPQIGMNAENQQKWRAGTLTIGELLLTQPGVILQNGD